MADRNLQGSDFGVARSTQDSCTNFLHMAHCSPCAFAARKTIVSSHIEQALNLNLCADCALNTCSEVTDMVSKLGENSEFREVYVFGAKKARCTHYWPYAV